MSMGGTTAMAITQALGSDAAATGLSPDEPLRARGGLLEFRTIADAARGPPRDPVVLERA
jgi:NaMN:DMB phosphoribosyltransferase